MTNHLSVYIKLIDLQRSIIPMKLTTGITDKNLISACDSVINDMNEIINRIDNTEDVDLEGFGLNLISSINASFRKLATSFKDNILNVVTNMERSELRHYTDIHKMKVNRVFDAKYHKLMDEKIFTPEKMKGSYRDVTDMLLNLYAKLNMLETMKEANEAFQKFYMSVSKEGEESFKHLNVLLESMVQSNVEGSTENMMNDLYGVSPKDQEVLKEQQQQIVTQIMHQTYERIKTAEKFEDPNKSEAERKFKLLFGNMKEYKSVFEDLLNQEPRYQESKTVNGNMELIDDTLDNITDMVESEQISKEDISGLASIVKALALNVSSYGFALATQMKLEHNLILSNQVLFKSL